jgi:phospholipase/carboxylesterase
MKTLISTILVLFCLLAATAPAQDLMEDTPRDLVSRGMTALSAKDYPRAVNYFKQAIMLGSASGPVAYNLACCYSLMGQQDSALAWVERAIDKGMYEFEGDKDFDTIREAGKFKKLCAKAAKQLQKARQKPWPPLFYQPKGYDTTATAADTLRYPLLVALHGWGGSPRDFQGEVSDLLWGKRFFFLVPYGTEVHGLNSFSWSRLDSSETAILAAVAKVKDRYPVDTSKIYLMGYSQGGYLAFSVGIRNPTVFRAVITAAGEFSEADVADRLSELAARDFRAYIMIGGKDEPERVQSNMQARQLINDSGARARLQLYPTLGHALPPDFGKEVERALNYIMQ